MMSIDGQGRAIQSVYAVEFVEFCIQADVLRFGEFTTKAGRQSPYFFNAGGFDDGVKLGKLAHYYAQCLQSSSLQFDMLFGPAYKGIPLSVALAIELGRMGRQVGYSFNRKEAKSHGEGGALVGAPLQGRVLIVDDVISAGTSIRESIAIINAAGAIPCGVIIALDRQEKMAESSNDIDCSAVQYVTEHYGLKVCAVANLDDLLQTFKTRTAGPGMSQEAWAQHHEKIAAYRQKYGVEHRLDQLHGG
ncbi:MAG: orotate phosphoribosyltransferase [Burkholderiaceae bacterium]